MLNQVKNIFIVGIKGVAMANLALILKKMGKRVYGSDVAGEFITDELLTKNNITYSVGFSPDNLPTDAELLVYAASHEGTDNPQVKEAKKRGVAVVSQPELMNTIMSQFKNKIAVCGTHGKTTTASLLSYVLIKLDLAPSYLVGTPRFDEYWGGDFTKGDYFVVEADEYGVAAPIDKTPKFHFLKPDYIIATTVDFDHPDTYQDLAAVKAAFSEFFQNCHPKLMVGCLDDQNLKEILDKITKTRVLTYGFSKEADLVVNHGNVLTNNSLSRQTFSASFQGRNLGEFKLSIFGKHNILNAAAVILFCLGQRFDLDRLKTVLEDFIGAQRRSEFIAKINRVFLFDDYAHHPAEIGSTITAFKSRFADKRLIVIFQPHTFSRTEALKSDFVDALAQADLTVVTDIFPSARESPDEFTIKSVDIEKEAQKKGKNHVGYIAYSQLNKFLSREIKRGDVICLMGAGDIYRIKNDIIKIMQGVKI